MALEATGAGTYSAAIPLSRPGTYIAVARDELSGEAVGTTGAVLTAGEELRPTGSDLALLGRVVELTGGKKRDTLAGIFADRASRRFSYKDATPALVMLAAWGLLLAVAARRLAMPDAVARWAARAVSTLRALRVENAVEKRDHVDAEATLGALLTARDRGVKAREGEGTKDEGAAVARQPVAAPRPVVTAPRPVVTAPPLSAPPPQVGGAAERPMSAAEILLARRKKKGG
jgi:hypothetical protein